MWRNNMKHKNRIRYKIGVRRYVKPFYEEILELAKSIPEEELDKLPTDGASNIDNYVYGVPKDE